VDVVPGRILHAHRPERIETDVELDLSEMGPGLLDAIEQGRGEVESGRRSRRAVLVRGEYRLIRLGVLERPGDVGRQRDFPDAPHHVQEPALPHAELHESSARVLEHTHHQPAHLQLAEEDLRSWLEPASGPNEALPRVTSTLAQQQHLYRAAAALLDAVETRRHDTGLVDDDKVTGPDVLGEIGEHAVVDLPARAVDHHQATRVPGHCRTLGDHAAGQLVVELRSTHASPPSDVRSKDAAVSVPLAAAMQYHS
jgi:hypothetical protein